MQIEPPCQTWIFQANPKYYRIKESLQKESEEFWNLRQHASDVQVGDRVLIWICGSEAGIYALGSVITPPTELPDSPAGEEYWSEQSEARNVRPRVLVQYEEVFLERPLLKVFLQCDPDLWGLRIIEQPRGTNFPVTPQEWKALKQWLDRWPIDIESLLA